MADEIKHSVLDEEKTLELHEQGVVAWNQEMTKRPTDVTFRGELDNCDFKGYVFLGKAVFYRVVFNHNAEFEHAEFQSEALFLEATFKHNVNFDQAKFINDDMPIVFYNSIFKSITTFKKVKFASFVTFSGCEFHDNTSFAYS
ncbi:MAG: pentapeptide repeat-containing protein, partial [Gammaproteobacteria bacterium]|nr:pentapeptide repeat-containing protein [Gammaproteobacteria bacterium]